MAGSSGFNRGFGGFDGSGIGLVVFDVDGTLYSHGPLRMAMARDLAVHAAARFDLQTPRIIESYRRAKEVHADAETPGFETVLLAEVAARHGVSAARVAAIVADWIETRPLPHLRRARIAGVAQVFDNIRRSGRHLAILSDYPAAAKLTALGLAADIVVAAGDADVGIMKPNPRGLQHIMAIAGAAPTATVLIGDRPERDGQAARRAGAAALIRRRQPAAGWQCFADFTDPLFNGLAA